MRKLFVIAITVLGLTAFAAGASACPYHATKMADPKRNQTTTVAKGKSDQSTTSETDS